MEPVKGGIPFDLPKIDIIKVPFILISRRNTGVIGHGGNSIVTLIKIEAKD